MTSARFAGNDEASVARNQAAFQLDIQGLVAEDLGVQSVTDYESEISKRVAFIKQMLLNSHTQSLVLGVSGGVDSLCAGLMCQRAVNELNALAKGLPLPQYRFVAVKLPYKVQSDHDAVDMSLSCIQPSQIEEVNLENPVDAIRAGMSPTFKKEGLTSSKVDFNIGNVKARMRMLIQYCVAGSCHGLVVGTDHASEAVTGFFTKFGDGGFDFSPLQGLVKAQVREIAKRLGAPESLYQKVPTADLEDLAEGIPDEKALGVSYEHIDAYLLGKDVSKDVFDTITGHYMKTQHKRMLPTLMV
ncbi:MAG: ammonia-dependent NAD(+) synthetase [Castellaniella sp.]|nr:MAG: ammonia-dependent NAD(+) synthetase [Castellaniella sp.]